MSYDIWLGADLGGPEPITLDNDWNYTCNCSPMWRAAGADLAEFHGRVAADCIPVLRAAIDDMATNPARYEPMNPPNGWGSLDTHVPALQRLLGHVERAPQATVRVSR